MKMCHINRVNQAKKELITLYKRSVRDQNLTQKQVQDGMEKILDRLRSIKTMPQYAIQGAGQYANALFELMNDHLVFLYTVEGKLYRTHLTKTGMAGELPCWDTLPRDIYCNLQDKGHLHWENTLNIYF